MPKTAHAPTPFPAPPSTMQQGLSLRPRDAIHAVNPYALGRFAPSLAGIECLTVWCPDCDHSLEVFEMLLTPHDLYIEGVCWCRDRLGKVGIYKRLRIPLRRGALPHVDDEEEP